jgi:hypothetical protein
MIKKCFYICEDLNKKLKKRAYEKSISQTQIVNNFLKKGFENEK